MTALRPCAALVLALLSAGTANAVECNEGEVSLIGCEFADAKGSFDGTGFSLCGIPPASGEVWTGLHYAFDRAGVRELDYPSDPLGSEPRFFTHHLDFQGLYRFRIRFENAGYTYEIYVEENPAPTDPDEVPSVEAGVRVFKGGMMADGQICGESPRPYYTYIRRSTACDLNTPYGEKVCADDPPEVK